MPGATMTTVNAMLKEIYEGRIEDQKNEEVIAVKRIESSSANVVDTVGGKYVTFPIRTRRNAGISYRAEDTALAAAGQQGYAAVQVPLKYGYGRFRVTGPVMRDICWFDLTDPDFPNNTDYSDYTLKAPVGSRVIQPIATSFASKAWDNSAFFRSKRHTVTTIEIRVPGDPNSQLAEFHSSYLFDRNLVSDVYEFYVDSKNYGTLAHVLPGAGYNRRLQLVFDTVTVVEYTITGFDLTYFNKRDI